jgi:hypothetical protein
MILMAFMVGFIAASALLGNSVLTRAFRYYRQSLLRETLLGLILWWIIGWLPFYIGMVIKAAMITAGFAGFIPPWAQFTDVRSSGAR